MKILCISDEESKALWDYGTREKLEKYDLILACGDLKAEYLSYLVTMARCPLLYVHGNHDASYEKKPPEGCDCVDGGLVIYHGVRILGLGGCRKYRESPHHYTERQMQWRILRIWFRLHRLGGVDIIMTHAAPEGLGDLDDNAHRGFLCFHRLLEKYPPQYWLYGHSHLYYGSKRLLEQGSTTLINCCGAYELDLPDRDFDPKYRNRILWKTKEPRIEDEWDLK